MHNFPNFLCTLELDKTNIFLTPCTSAALKWWDDRVFFLPPRDEKKNGYMRKKTHDHLWKDVCKAIFLFFFDDCENVWEVCLVEFVVWCGMCYPEGGVWRYDDSVVGEKLLLFGPNCVEVKLFNFLRKLGKSFTQSLYSRRYPFPICKFFSLVYDLGYSTEYSRVS